MNFTRRLASESPSLTLSETKLIESLSILADLKLVIEVTPCTLRGLLMSHWSRRAISQVSMVREEYGFRNGKLVVPPMNFFSVLEAVNVILKV